MWELASQGAREPPGLRSAGYSAQVGRTSIVRLSSEQAVAGNCEKPIYAGPSASPPRVRRSFRTVWMTSMRRWARVAASIRVMPLEVSARPTEQHLSDDLRRLADLLLEPPRTDPPGSSWR